MAIGWHGTPNPADEEMVERLERRLGLRLPDEYRDVLLHHDGQSVEPCHFHRAGGQVQTVRFYSLHDEGLLRCVLEDESGQWDFLREGNMVPFGRDPHANVGGQLLLDFRESPDKPGVAYLDAWLQPEAVAESFAALMGSLFDPKS